MFSIICGHPASGQRQLGDLWDVHSVIIRYQSLNFNRIIQDAIGIKDPVKLTMKGMKNGLTD